MSQQSAPGKGLGTAHPVPYSPSNPEQVDLTEDEKEEDYESLEEALLGE